MKKLAILLLLAVTVGCAAFSQALPKIVEVLNDVSDGAMILDQIEHFVSQFFAAHPNADLQKKIDAALTKTHEALIVLNRTAQGGEKLDQKHVGQALADFQAAYEELALLLDGVDGIHLQRPGEALQARPGELSIPVPLAIQTEAGQ